MKKILVSLMVIALAVGFAAAGSLAYFDDTELSAGNTFTAGTIDISINPTSGHVVTAADNEIDLKPGMTGNITITVTNDGNNPADLWKMVGNVSTEENGIPEPEQAYYTANSLTEKNDIDTVILYSMTKDGASVVSTSEDFDVSDVAGQWIYLGVIVPQQTITIVQSYMMRTDTGNWAQSDKMTYDITFFAQQSQADDTASLPLPGTELVGHLSP